MKTEIKQSEPEFLIRIEDRPKGLMIVQDYDNWVYVEKENIKQLALILCPELSQPELKAVKTAEDYPIFYKDLNDLYINKSQNCLSDYGKEKVKEFEKIKKIINQFSQPKEGAESRNNFAIGFGKFITDNKYGSTEGNYEVILNDYIESLTEKQKP